MLLANRGRRSLKARVTTGIALLSMFAGPLRIAYAIPVLPAQRLPLAAPPATPLQPAPQGPAAGRDKLSTDSPSALATRLGPTRVTVLDGAADAVSIAQLFDGRAATGLAPGGRPVKLRLDLAGPARVEGVAIFGPTGGAVTIEATTPSGRTAAAPRESATAGVTAEGWIRRDFAQPTVTSSLTLTFEPRQVGAVLRELEIWGRPAALAQAAADVAPLLPDSLYTGLPPGARALTGAPAEQTVALSTVSGPGAGGTFVVKADADVHAFERAFLVYELSGLPHFTAALRSINGQKALGRFAVSRGAPGGLAVEEIDPASLREGDNRVQFFPADEHDPGSYRVRNLRVVGIPYARTRLSDASARAWSAVRDARETTGWKAEPGKPGERRIWELAQVTQPWALEFRLPARETGTLTIASATADPRTKAGTKGTITVRLDDLAPGWHQVPLGRFPATDKLAIELTSGKELSAAVSELAIEGSPIPIDQAPRMTVTFPLSGECVNHQAHMRGFVSPAGANALFANGARVDGALSEYGAFAFELGEKQASGRVVTVEARYPGGARVRQDVSVGRCLDRAPVVVADDGRPRQPLDDVGAPFGAVVRAHERATLTFDGVRLDIPAGAVDKDVRLTIRPLPAHDVAPMDAGMTNVTPSGSAYRFGPLGMQFKKPVKMTVPYDGRAIPAGYGREDVRTYYYDEALHHWEEVGLVSENEHEMVAASNHFTDFVNATIAMPEHPGTQSMNPTSLKDMKLADPSAGITQMDPPSADPSGAARLSFPINTPRGRRGIEPRLALGYDSERTGTSGWVGVGWDLALSSIEIDTRFGVPRYDGSELYSLDGERLTPIAGSPGFYQRRVEGRFDRIQRLGTGPANYSWLVTDKSGTKFTYGANANGANSTLPDARPGQPGNIFKWSLERVEDPLGNFMTVSYFRDTYTTGDTFTQIYPLQIRYTGGPGLAAPYQVDFTLDDGATRPDVAITGRPGFPVSTRRRLTEVRVSLSGSLIRAYELEYLGADHFAETFNKSVLSAVSMRGTPGTAASELYRHTFDYFKAPSTDAMFSAPQGWGTLGASDGLAHSNDQLAGGSGSIGIGFLDIFSATVSGGGDSGSTTPNLAFVDANGDGLPDQLALGGAASLNQLAGASPGAHFGGATFPGLGGLGHTNRSGWTAGGSLSALDGLFGIGGSYSQHTAEDDQVVTDMNGDGFPDVVSSNGGGVSVQLNTGMQSFAAPQPWNSFSLSGVQFTRQDRFGQAGQAGAFFPADPLIRWVAPFDGALTANATFQKAAAGGDGVRVDVFVNNESAPRGSCAFGPNDLAPCALSIPLAASAGDRIYTKVDGLGDPGADEVTSAMTVTYAAATNPALASQVEPFGSPIYTFDRATDFRLAGLPSLPWTASADGSVQVQGCFSKSPTADDVTLAVVKKTANAVVDEITFPIASSAVGMFCIPQLQQALMLQMDQTLSFEVRSDVQIDPGTINWPVAVTYTSYCRLDPTNHNPVCAAPVCTGGFCTIGPTDPLANFPIPQGLIQAPGHVYYPAFAWKAVTPGPTASTTVASSGPTSISWSVSTTTSRLVLLVQGVNKLLAKQTIDAANPAATIQINLSLQAGEQLFFTVLSPDGVPVPPFTVGIPSVNGSPVASPSSNVLYPDPAYDNVHLAAGTPAHDPMSGGYHRWWYGDWNGSRAFNEAQIVVSPSPQKTDSFLFATPSVGLATRPDLGATPMWLGRAAAELMAPGRINPGLSASGAATGKGAAIQALRVSDTWNVDLQASAVGLEAALNAGDSTTDIDLMDMNGDRYPDSVTAGAVQYNDGVGAFTSRASIDMGLANGGDLRSTTNVALRFGIGLGGVGQLINLTNTGTATKEHVSTDVVSASTDYGVNSTRVDFVDVNGDGLPDHVSHRPGDGGLHVRLNLGYGFSNEMVWSSDPWQRSEIPASILGFDSGAITSALGAVGSIVGNSVTGTDAVRFQDTQTNNLSLGIPAGDVFGAGGGPTVSLSRTIADFIDINGDGLPDQVMRAPDEAATAFRVKLNLGDHFGPETVWSIPAWPFSTSLPSIDLLNNPDGVGYSTMAGWAASVHVQVCFILCVGGSGFYSRNNGGTNMSFEDINGDGKPDQVLKMDGTGTVFTKLNQAGKTNLLKTVHRPLGSTINLDYQPAGNFVLLTTTPQIDMPSNQWSLASVTVDDARLNTYTNSVDYAATAPSGLPASVSSGFYNRAEREEQGYGHVHLARTATAQGVDISDHSQVDTFYLNQDYYRKQRLQADFESDANGKILRGTNLAYATPPPLPVATGSFFPAEQERRALFYEKASGFSVSTVITAIQAGQTPPAPKFKLEKRQFDAQGNLIDLIDAGDEQTTADDLEYKISYATDPTGAYIVLPSEIDAFPAGNPAALLRKRLASYNPGTGTMATLTNIVSGGKVPASGTPGTVYNQASSIFNYTYDAFGNLLTFADPSGYKLQYTYDPTTQTYRTRVDDKSFGYFSTASYDLRFGTLTQSSDVNGQPEALNYDIFGRLCSVRGPDDQATSDATITMSYGIVPSSCAGGPPAGAAFPPYAVTRHKDMQHTGDPIDTVTFVDGLDRVIQKKKDIDRDQNGNSTIVTGTKVSGQVLFDGRGRLKSEAQPAFSTAAITTFIAAGNISNPTTYAYDEIGRQTGNNIPDGTAQGIQTTTSYSILLPAGADGLGDNGTWLLAEVRDGNAPLPPTVSNVGRRLTYSDSRENRIAVREYNQIGTATTLTALTTRYGYDPIDQLLSVTDAQGNVTSSAYDTVGQMVSLTSLDAGQIEYRFDLAGNLKERQTPVLRGQSRVITYGYDFDRLKSITYPTLTPVTYAYGASTEKGDASGNVAGRIKQVTFEAGNEARTYDHLGNVNKTVTTLNRMSTTTGLPATIAFTMNYTYDWLGRLQNMTFPNWIDQSFKILAGPGELITYVYDRGGNIDRITGFDQTPNPQQTSTPRNYTYLSHIGYNEFEQRTVLTSGNGIANSYLYEPTNRRLTDVRADTFGALEHQLGKPATPFHRMHYSYDKVGNVTHLVNNVSVQPWRNAGVFVGPHDISYTYDNLYQLRSLTGKYRPNVAYGYQYSDTFRYDQINNMSTKAGSQDRLVWDNQTVNTGDTNPVVTQLAGSRFDHNVTALTYSLAYQYTASRPHAAAPITETPAGVAPSAHTYTYDANGNNTGGAFQSNTRVQVWDEENRLKEVDRNGGFLAKFRYDDQGERRKKQTAAGDAWYVNQYFVLLPNNLPTKHIFAGETRIASKTDAIYMQTPALSYYHTDNLGSTSYTSAANQDLLQHERYFAFGELWRPGSEQEETDLGRPDNLRREYTLTGKEWDVDEGLYYFGARYFDPHADAWQNPDPMLSQYMSGRSNSGVYTPQNLGLYTYSWNNPIILQDLDGSAVGDPWYTRAVKTAVGVAYGTLQAITPGGVVLDVGRPPSNDSDFLKGKAAGQFATGVVETLGGGAAALGGGAAEVVTVGVGTPIAVPVAVAGLAVAANGTANVVASGTTMQMAAKAEAAERASLGSGPPPNGGVAKPHGGTAHDKAIEADIKELKNDPEVTNIRKNQQQVDVNGNKVGTNRPDVQYDKGGCHHCVEHDTRVENGTQHGETIRRNDPAAKVELKEVKQ